MSVIRLVRHGRAAAAWDADPDPDLDELGRQQAAEVAARLPTGGGTSIVTSPLRRCRSTAAAFAAVVGVEPVVDPRVAEIPSPEGIETGDRGAWLRQAMQGTWTELGPRYAGYRDEVVDAVRGLPDGAVVFSHFIAINTVIGGCLGDDRLVLRRLANCSITTVEVVGGVLRLVEGGHEADTLVR